MEYQDLQISKIEGDGDDNETKGKKQQNKKIYFQENTWKGSILFGNNIYMSQKRDVELVQTLPTKEFVDV